MKSKSILEDFKGLTKLWPFLKSQKRNLIFAIILIPFISFFQSYIPLLIRRAIDEGIVAGDLDALTQIGVIYFAVVVLEYISRGAQTMLTAVSVHRMIRDMRAELTKHILKLSCSFHDKNMSGALVTRATSDFDNLSESLNQGVLSSIVDLAVLIGALTGLFMLDAKLALITIVIIPIVGVIVTRFSKSLKKTMLAARKWIANLNAYTQESLFNVKTIKLLNAEDDVNKKFTDLAYKYRDAQMGSVVLDSVMFSLLDGISSITIGVILWFALDSLSAETTLSAGVMIAFVQYTQNLFDPLKQLGNKIAMLQGAFTAIDRIFHIFFSKGIYRR